MSDYTPKSRNTLPIIFDDRMPVNNLIPKIVNRVNDNTNALKNLHEETETIQEDIEGLETTKADKDGSYENLTAGNAEQLLTDKGITDKVPYLLRASGGNGADREEDKIVGGTIAWNQLLDTSLYRPNGAYNGVTLANNGNYLVINGTISEGTAYLELATVASRPSFIEGHKYLFDMPILPSNANNGFFLTLYGTAFGNFNVQYPTIKSCLATTQESVFPRLGRAGGYAWNNFIYYLNVIDLTAMFGTAIADRAYAMEQATAGSGIAWLKSMGFFQKDYYPYDAGTLKSVEGLTAHIMRDSEDNIIASYPLDSTLTLRGIPKLDSNNQVYYDGDTYESDGTVTRRYGVVDLGTLNWTFLTEPMWNCFFTIDLATKKNGTNNLICGKYPYSPAFNTDTDKIISGNGGSKAIYIRDIAYSDAATFKAALSGVMLVYELETFTTEEADPYQNPQIVDPYGTEEYETTGIVPVGHETFYPENLRAKIEGLPFNFATLIAPTESTYKATRAYSANNLFIVDNVLYKATTSIASGGTITPGTNCTATTLAEIIAALS